MEAIITVVFVALNKVNTARRPSVVECELAGSEIEPFPSLPSKNDALKVTAALRRTADEHALLKHCIIFESVHPNNPRINDNGPEGCAPASAEKPGEPLRRAGTCAARVRSYQFRLSVIAPVGVHARDRLGTIAEAAAMCSVNAAGARAAVICLQSAAYGVRG